MKESGGIHRANSRYCGTDRLVGDARQYREWMVESQPHFDTDDIESYESPLGHEKSLGYLLRQPLYKKLAHTQKT